MHNIKNIIKIALFISAIFLPHSKLWAQDYIYVEQAKEIYFDKTVTDAQILRGNVIIKQKDARMFCDSANYWQEKNLARAYGKVQINQNDTLNVYGDSLSYYGISRSAKLDGNVKVIDNSLILKTPSLVYELDSNKAYYNNYAVIYGFQNQDTLVSKNGIYYSQKKYIEFTDSVIYKGNGFRLDTDTLLYDLDSSISYFRGPTRIITGSDTIFTTKGWYNTKLNTSSFDGRTKIQTTEQTIEGDNIVYDRANGIGEIHGNMVLTDTVNDFILTGDYGYFNENKGTSIVTGKPLLTQYFEEDTLFLMADTLFAIKDNASKKQALNAYHNVRFFKKDIQGICDSLYYAEEDSTLKLFTNPVIWSDANQLTGDYIDLTTSNGKLHKMYIENNAFIIAEEDTASYNQIKGKNMTGFFKDGELGKVNVSGNGQTVYYATEEDEETKKKTKITFNKIECSNIVIYMEDKGIKSISFLVKPDGASYPMDQINPKDLYLKDFNWQSDRRPNSLKELYTKF